MVGLERESIAAVRFFHRTLFVLCLAIIIFALAPNDLPDVKAAGKELALVRGERLEKFRSVIDTALREAKSIEPQEEQLAELCERLGIEYESTSYPDASLSGLDSSPLENIERFLLAEFASTVPIGANAKDGLIELTTFLEQNGTDFTVKVNARTGILYVFVGGKEYKHWPLTDGVMQRVSPFPGLRKYWDDLGPLDPGEAEIWLGKREEAITKGLDILGFRLERSLMIWVIPSVTLIGMLALVVYMASLYDAISAQLPEYRRAVPWIVLMVRRKDPVLNAIAEMLAIGSSTVVPITAAWLVVYQSWDVAAPLDQVLGIVGGAGTTLVGSWATWLVLKTRRVAY